jgi:DNA-binding CsgD family transcriptional regulator
MPSLDTLWDERNRRSVLAISAALIVIIATVDWWTKPYVSLGFLYLFPIMLAAGLLPRWGVAQLAVGCALLSAVFSSLERSWIRVLLETLALGGCGLFVAELVRNRRLTLEAQERLRILVETSPAAIVTVDERGFIEVANRAAVELIAPDGAPLGGNPIAAFLPDLHYALRKEEGPQFRASMQCRGRRANGEPFLADVWFSTYKEGAAPKLAAIITAVGEESPTLTAYSSSNHRVMPALNPREADVLRYVVQGLSNKEIAARMDISESTVKNTLQQLFAKSEVRTRSQLVRVALEYYRDLL